MQDQANTILGSESEQSLADGSGDQDSSARLGDKSTGNGSGNKSNEGPDVASGLAMF